jgi:DNA-binding GntR family transcriptional regulator
MKASDTIYSALRRRLMTGHYAPGSQLKETEIAAEFDLSRTPVRAALSQLVAQGLLVAEPNRGVFVAEWTERDLQEVFSLRRLLESNAAGLAAQRRTGEQLQHIRALQALMVEAARGEGPEATAKVQSTNNAFHRAILRASASPRLIGICDSLVDTPMIIGSFYLYDRSELDRSLQQHDEIVRAIALMDFEYAVSAMSLHLKSTFETYMAKRAEAGASRHQPSPAQAGA